MLPLLLLACGQGAPDPTDGDPAPSVQLVAAPALDPLSAIPLEIAVQAAPRAEVQVQVLDEAGLVRMEWADTTDPSGSLQISWDGWIDDQPMATGPAVLRAVASAEGGEGVAQQDLAIVRPGFLTVHAHGAERIPLYWGASRRLQDLQAPIAALDHLEGPDGRSQDLPPLATSIYWEPDEAAHPVAYPFDARPTLTLQPAADSSLGATGLELVDLAVEVEGWSAVSGLPLSPDAPLVLQADAPLGQGPGLFEDALTLRFQATDEAGTPWTVAEQRLPLRAYLLLGPPTFSADAPEYQPWVAVVDPALRAIHGVQPQAGAVVDALVQHIYFDLDLRYDAVWGASHYSTYVWGDYARPHFLLTDFLQRLNGHRINCTDAGNILAAWANMLGAPLDHVVLEPAFNLNEIKAIGHDSYTSCPFGPMGCGFSYHALTTVDGGQTVWDATLALDGDDDPGSAPHTELLVQGLTGAEYLQRLVRSGNPSFQDQAEITLE